MLSYLTSGQNLCQVCLGGAWRTPACPWCAQAAACPPWKLMVFLCWCWAPVRLSLASYKSAEYHSLWVKTDSSLQPWIVGWPGFFRADLHRRGRYVPGTGMPSHWVRVHKIASKNLVGKHSTVNGFEVFFPLNKGSVVVASSLYVLYNAPSLPHSQKDIDWWWSISCIHNICK